MSTLITSQDLQSTEPLDSAWVQERLKQYPFVEIDGVSNARTLGFYEVKHSEGERAQPRMITRSYQLYRSAEVSSITDTGELWRVGHKIRRLTLTRKGSAEGAWDTKGVRLEINI